MLAIVILSRNPGKIHNILVPVGGGPHSRLALRIAFEIADQENARGTVLHLFSAGVGIEEIADEPTYLSGLVIEELGYIPPGSPPA